MKNIREKSIDELMKMNKGELNKYFELQLKINKVKNATTDLFWIILAVMGGIGVSMIVNKLIAKLFE